ncbi:MAG TPA: hypothetical protein H9691_03745 [Firmicutes bacterium]|nr:hypothetical protein [Bacillota bacterium]
MAFSLCYHPHYNATKVQVQAGTVFFFARLFFKKKTDKKLSYPGENEKNLKEFEFLFQLSSKND